MELREGNLHYRKNWFPLLLAIGVLANAAGLFVTILEPDGALYATIAKTIYQSGDYINLMVEGKDWLDKPHFPFWMAALSFEVFGATTFAYKIPAFLFFLAGGFYTYLLAARMYSSTVAKTATLIYLTAAHLVISNNDVRAEPYLTALIIGSVYHFYRSFDRNAWLHVIAGSLLAACALMTKGPFAIIIIGSGIFIDAFARKQWSRIFNYRWILALIFTTAFVIPELYCLYAQFDAHPEKIVFGRTNVSGIRFFFWDSQFGRFMNTGPIKGKGDPFFYLHTVLWAFLPWSLLFYGAVINRFKKRSSLLIIGTTVVTFLMFSLSRFQLPHYMNVVFPFFAILTATYILDLQSPKWKNIWRVVQTVLFFILSIAPPALAILYGMKYSWLIAGLWLAVSVGLFFYFRSKSFEAAVWRSMLAATSVYFFLNIFFYPSILQYQSGTHAAKYLNEMKDVQIVHTLRENSYSFGFYANPAIRYWQETAEIKAAADSSNIIVFTKLPMVDSLKAAGIPVKLLATFPHFHISALKGKFINPRTRESMLSYTCLVKVERK